MRSVYVIFAVVSSIIGTSGVILNFLVCLLYFTTPQLLDAANIFILNIAIGDLTYSIVALPLVVTSNAQGQWIFGEAGCIANGFLTAFFALGSILNLAGVAYQRYFVICKLYKTGETEFSCKKAMLLSAMLWCYSFFWSLMPVLGWSSFTLEGIGTSCSVNWRSREAIDVSYSVCLMLACFVLPVVVIIYCYYKIYKAMSELSENAAHNWGPINPLTHHTVQAERKMTWITITMTAGFLIAWTPYAVFSVLAILNPDLVSDISASIPAYLAKSSACYNPIIYAFLYKKIRRRLVDLFCCKSGRGHPVHMATDRRRNGNQTERMEKQEASKLPLLYQLKGHLK